LFLNAWGELYYPSMYMVGLRKWKKSSVQITGLQNKAHHHSQWSDGCGFQLRRKMQGFAERGNSLLIIIPLMGARGSVVGWGTLLQARRSRVRVPKRWIFFN
jgi:hypothetical protein